MKNTTDFPSPVLHAMASVFAAIFLLAIPALSQAAPPLTQPPAQFAQVDLRLILMLHPTMMRYDFGLNRFMRISPSQSAAMKSAEAEVERRRPEVEKAIKSLQAERDKVLREMSAARLTASIRAAPISSLREKAQLSVFQAAGTESKAIEVRGFDPRLEPNGVAGVSVSAEKAVTDYGKRLAELGSKIQSQYEHLQGPLYYTTNESQKIFNDILAEVKAIVGETARQHGISTVMNACPIISGEPHQMVNPGATVPSGERSRSFDQLFETLINSKFEKFELPPLPDNPRVMAGIGMTITDPLRAYLAKSGSVAALQGSPEVGQLFLYGGLDLTGPVVKQSRPNFATCR